MIVPERLDANPIMSADEIIHLLDLRPLADEGGHFRQTYRAESPAGDPSGSHPLATAIYYLVTPRGFSAMHRLPGDEIFHFYLGDAIDQLHLFADGTGRVVRIGTDLTAGERPQMLVPGGVWQGSRLVPGGRHGFALLGTTMTPGFEFADYEGGERSALAAAYPAFRAMIAELTR